MHQAPIYPQSLRRRVASFIEHPIPSDFGPLVVEAARLQAARIPAYRRICDSLGIDPTQLDDWRQIAPVPTLAFKRERFCVEAAKVVFRSSGTGVSGRSEHHQPWPELYDLAVDRSFPGASLPAPAPVSMLSLIPPPALVPDSSLSHMIARVMHQWGGASSVSVAGAGGVDCERGRIWLERAASSPQPVLILATAFALVELLDYAEAQSWRVSLPAGSVLWETGGYKGRSRELNRRELGQMVLDRLGINPTQIVREYGMSELSSQLYASTLSGGDPERYEAPPWVRVRVLDPATLEDTATGETGLVSVVDLANAGSAVHVLTEDLGRLDQQGRLELLGRAAEAELRGCSLTAEALSQRPM